MVQRENLAVYIFRMKKNYNNSITVMKLVSFFDAELFF